MLSQGKAIRDLDDQLLEYVTGAQALSPGATLLGLDIDLTTEVSRREPWSRKISIDHALDAMAQKAGAVSLNDYEAKVPFFFTAYKQAVNPYFQISLNEFRADADGWWGLAAAPPRVEFLNFHQRTGGCIDYVWVWDSRRRPIRDSSLDIWRQLEGGYREVYVSTRGFGHMYRRISECRPHPPG
jgi:hypothetical protein